MKNIETAKTLLSNDKTIFTNNDIYSAAKTNNIEMVKDILNHPNFNIEMFKDIGLVYTMRQSPESAVLLIEKGINIKDTSFFFNAIAEKAYSVVEAMLAREDFDVNAKGSSGKTLLKAAIEDGNEAVISKFLARSDLKIDSSEWCLVTDYLTKHPQVDVLQFLEAMARPDFDPNQKVTISQYDNHQTSLLSHFIKKGQIELAKALLSNDKTIFTKDDIYIAAKTNNIEMVKNILNKPNLDIEMLKDIEISNIISFSSESAVLLIEKGINIDKQVFFKAIAEKAYSVVEAILVRKDFDVNAKGSSGKTLLKAAIEAGDEAVVSKFLARPDLKIDPSEWYSVIDYLTKHPKAQLPQHLIEPLSVHCKAGQFIELLKNANFDWSTTLSNGKTALHLLATKNGNNSPDFLSKLNDLLNQDNNLNEAISNVNKRDDNGDRAIDLLKDNRQLIKLLRDNGSVEPKNPIRTDVNTVEKLIMNDGTTMPPDGIKGNKEKTVKILELMFEKYQFSDKQIDDLITKFKADHELSWYGGILAS